MYKNHKIGVIVPIFNEMPKILNVIERLKKESYIDTMVFIDDCSDDGSYEYISKEDNVKVIRHPKRKGVGAAIRTGFAYLMELNIDISVMMAGNDKDRPSEIPRLLDKVIDEDVDFVQGSRYLAGGITGNTPFIRALATRWIYPLYLYLITGKRLSDVTNGFRTIRMSLIRKLWQDLQQDWLNKYELEYYLLYKTITNGFRIAEVPVSKIYPNHNLGYSKVGIKDWWSILKPLILLKLRLKR